jgi:serine/threonine protein kinase
LPPSFVLSGYEIRVVLGRGGFGVTYKALDRKNNQTVVIKEYFPAPEVMAVRRVRGFYLEPNDAQSAQEFAEGLSYFLKEAKFLTKFNHANIVPIMNFFPALGTAYFVMPYLEGETLDNIVASKPERKQTPREVMAWLDPILDGLQAVHARGILHRDIKPSNIFIQKNHNPVLIDFGAAGDVLAGQKVPLALTHGYAPPEQYSANIPQGPWTDIYSLGAVIYYVLSGLHLLSPQTRIGADPCEIIFKKLEHEHDQNLIKTMERCLKLNYQERIQGVAELRQALGSTINRSINPLPKPKNVIKPLIANKGSILLKIRSFKLKTINVIKETYLYLFKNIKHLITFLIVALIIVLFFKIILKVFS